jgi:GH15 family glucan-1,4-alpha-glucosidase
MSIKKLKKKSIQVLKDCCLENGAIVAGNPTKKYYPPEAKHYFYVWPRDASFICIAADLMRIKKIQEGFFDWCLERAESFKRKGLFFEKYYVNGLKALHRFQPDQGGSILFAIHHHYKKKLSRALKYEELIRKTADGLCDYWERDHFIKITNDLWEERHTFPDLKDSFTYDLAACSKGLECASKIIPNQKWLLTAEQMKNKLKLHYNNKFFVRSHGLLSDEKIDASMFGLVYPFGVVEANDERMVSTVKRIEKKLVVKGGIQRYEGDEYDGWIYEGFHRNKGAGAWPLLNFWASIYFSILGDKKRAKKYFNWVIEKVDDYIPEQIFENDLQVSVSPLAWSHAMFLISGKFLKLF